MDKKKLEMMLERVPAPESPRPELEQYRTPSDIAADLLFNAFMLGDIEGRQVVDLGCGTGIFSIGAAILGAEEIDGIDVDDDSIISARSTARELGLDIEYKRMNVTAVVGKYDTVIMNPPFGAQKKHSDRAFLEKALEIGKVIYTMHNGPTAPFVRTYARALHGTITHTWDYTYVMPHQFDFHTKERKPVEIVAFRIEKGTLNGKGVN